MSTAPCVRRSVGSGTRRPMRCTRPCSYGSSLAAKSPRRKSRLISAEQKLLEIVLRRDFSAVDHSNERVPKNNEAAQQGLDLCLLRRVGSFRTSVVEARDGLE